MKTKTYTLFSSFLILLNWTIWRKDMLQGAIQVQYAVTLVFKYHYIFNWWIINKFNIIYSRKDLGKNLNVTFSSYIYFSHVRSNCNYDKLGLLS